LITAILGMSIFFLGFAFYLDEEHFLLKLLSLFFALISLMLLPKVFFNEYSTITTFLKVPLWFFRIFVTYFGAYLFYHWVQKSEVMAKLWGK